MSRTTEAAQEMLAALPAPADFVCRPLSETEVAITNEQAAEFMRLRASLADSRNASRRLADELARTLGDYSKLVELIIAAGWRWCDSQQKWLAPSNGVADELAGALMALQEEARKIFADEPELPGEMPDAMWNAIRTDRDYATEAMRLAVRQTKRNLLAKLDFALASYAAKVRS